jgi:hypothetical protein
VTMLKQKAEFKAPTPTPPVSCSPPGAVSLLYSSQPLLSLKVPLHCRNSYFLLKYY